MSGLIQKEDRYASYLGWFGVYGDSIESVDIASYPQIYTVYTIGKRGSKSYTKGQPSFLQGFTKFDVGVPYVIVLEKGSDTVQLSGFVLSSSDNIKMVLRKSNGQIEKNITKDLQTIPQSENNFSSCFGWYGVVRGDTCKVEDYDLTKNNNIYAALRFNEEGKMESYTAGNPSFLQAFTKLEIGKCYYIVLRKGSGDVYIENFISSNSITKIDNKSKFCVRLKTKVFVCLWNFRNMFGRKTVKFSDKSYYLGQKDQYGYPVKSKLKIKDIENMLNQENYVYPQQDDFVDVVTGSVTDYFRNVTRDQIDFKFEIINLGNDASSDDPDDWAYSAVERRRLNDSNQIKIDMINSFSQIRRKYKANVFPKNFDDQYKKYDRKAAFGLVIHSGDNKKIRARNLKVDVDSNRLTRRISICSIVDKTNQNRLEPIGVHVHELIHSFDLKDLYSNNISAMSKVDTMGYGFWGFTRQSSGKYFPFFPSSYTRLKMFEFFKGSINVVEISKDTKDIEIEPSVSSNSIFKIKNPNLPDIWYVDFRTDSETSECINFDREMGESGLSIVHEYPSLFDNRTAIPLHKRSESGLSVSLEQQDGLYQLQEKGLDYIEIGEEDVADNRSDFFKEGDEFSPYTLPSSTSYLGQPSGIKVHNIRKTEKNTMLFDVTFLEQPTNRILNVKYYTDSIKDSNLVPQTCGGRRNCKPTDNSPFEFDFKKVPYQIKNVFVEITTKDIPNGTKISLYYLKKDAVKFTNPGGWATSSVQNNKATMQVPRGLIGLYLENYKNHFIYKVDEGEFTNTYWYIDYIHVNR